jgi:transcriptional regulator with XRE-family HTH domain
VNKFAARLKELREERGITKKELSVAVHVSDTCVSRWENGSRTPNVDSIIALSQFFGVSADYLIGLVDY